MHHYSPTTNVTVKNIVPTVIDTKISISGGSGASSVIKFHAVYRKLQNRPVSNFVVDQNNAVHSVSGNLFTIGLDLVACSLCVQVIIQYGGSNDDDGGMNSAVADAGAVSVPVVVVNPLVEPSCQTGL